MGEHIQSVRFLTEMGIHLQGEEKVRSLLALGADNNEGKPPKEGILRLTDQRILHMPSGTGAKLQSAPLRDVAVAEVEKQTRYLGFLLAAGFVLITGVPFEVALAVSGAFSSAVLVVVLLLGGGFLAAWWYSAGDTMVRITTRDTKFEGLVASKREREATDFVNSLLELTG